MRRVAALARWAPIVSASLLLPISWSLGGCGSSGGGHRHRSSAVPLSPAPQPRGPAFGLTEENADLLWGPTREDAPGDAAFASARRRLTALAPSYVRLLVDWAALQPHAEQSPALAGSADGCARDVRPCGSYAGLRDELAAIASQQRAARVEGKAGFEVVLDVFGVPAWAARPPSGCELEETSAFSRPLNPAGLAGYRALIRSLIALGAREGVALNWWAPWNEPNDAVFLSPQRQACTSASASLAPAAYGQLARAMAGELRAVGGQRHLLLGELNAFEDPSPRRTSVEEFVSGLSADVLCLSGVWSVHAYARRSRAVPELDPVAALEAALDRRGRCGRRAAIWVTEAGAGAPHPGRPRPPGASEETAGCLALARQLEGWVADPRVQAIFQYSFREDPAFPVGLLSANLAHVYPAYRLWLAYTQARGEGHAPTAATASLCA